MFHHSYKKDHAQEQYLGTLLDAKLYTDALGFSDVRRNDDAATQKLGIDISFSHKNKIYKCDEKAATSYGVDSCTGEGHALRTYSFELFTTHSPDDTEGKPGWFLNPDILTDSYMLVWIDRFRSQPEWYPEEIRYALVNKPRMMSELAKSGLTAEKISERCEKIKECWAENGYRARREDTVRNGGTSRFHGKILLRNFDDYGPYFAASTTKGQFHINLVVPRDILRRISVANGTIKL